MRSCAFFGAVRADSPVSRPRLLEALSVGGVFDAGAGLRQFATYHDRILYARIRQRGAEMCDRALMLGKNETKSGARTPPCARAFNEAKLDRIIVSTGFSAETHNTMSIA